MESAITVKGQATIPKPIREHLELQPGDRAKFFVHPDSTVALLPKLSVSALRGIVKARSPLPVTTEQKWPRRLPRELWVEIRGDNTDIGLDTNILVCYRPQDDPVQSAKATEILERRLTPKNPGFVTIVAIVETVWAVDRAYGITAQEIATAVERLLQADVLSIESARRFSRPWWY